MTVAATRPPAFAVRFSMLTRWDVKSYAARLVSRYPMAQLGGLIAEHNEKVRLSERPRETFRILGVDNLRGVFHAYDAAGAAINQSYKRVAAGDLVYNPYRVNVGSIGMVPGALAGAYVSPAYVVFSVDGSRLAPELLLLVLKSDWYNPSLRAATAGSVRQNLTFELLQTIGVPLPSRRVQGVIVDRWRSAQERIAEIRHEVTALENGIPSVVYETLGTSTRASAGPTPKYMAFRWKDLDRWSVNHLARWRARLVGFSESRYPIVPLGECIVETANGYCIRPTAHPTPHRMLKLSALTPAGLDVEETKYVRVTERIAERFHVRKGDLLICRSVGSYHLIGKCAVVEGAAPGILFPDIIIRVRVGPSLMAEYAREVIQTPLGRSYFQSAARTAVGMWKIGADDIRSFPIPVPPLEVQREIVGEVEGVRSSIARLRFQAQKAEMAADQEMEALLLGLSPGGKP